MNHLRLVGPCALLLMACALCAACPGSATVGANVTVPKDSQTTCSQHCETIGMALDAVVVMADNVGCVCRAKPTGAPAGEPAGPASAAGGMAAVMIQQQQARQRQQQSRAR